MLINYHRLLLHKQNEVDACNPKNNEVELGGFRWESKWTIIIGIINGFPFSTIKPKYISCHYYGYTALQSSVWLLLFKTNKLYLMLKGHMFWKQDI